MDPEQARRLSGELHEAVTVLRRYCARAERHGCERERKRAEAIAVLLQADIELLCEHAGIEPPLWPSVLSR